jgi:hypothetical protein
MPVPTPISGRELQVELRGDDDEVAARVAAILASYGMTCTRDPGASGVTFELARAGVVRVPAAAREVGRQDGIRAWDDHGTIYLCCDAHTVRVEPGTGRCVGALPRTSDGVRKDVVVYGVLLLLRRRGVYGLHAAAVAWKGTGCLLVADRRAGKSTAALNLLRAGWSYLSDDAVALHACGGVVEALPLRRDCRLDDDALRHFPELGDRWAADPAAEGGKRRLDVRAHFPDRVRDRCTPRALVFPTLVPAPTSRLVPLDRAGALMRLVRQSVVIRLDAAGAPPHLDVLARLVAQARSYRLLAGRDLLGDPQRTARLLEEVVS